MGPGEMKNSEKRKRSLAVRIAGDIFLALCLLLTLDVVIVMTHKIRTVVLKNIYRLLFRQELVICALIILCALDLRFGIFGSFRSEAGRLWGWLMRITVISVTCICLVCFGQVLGGCFPSAEAEADNVLVLGMALENGQPSKDLVHRVETAKGYLDAHPGAKLILTGGNPDEKGRTEAAVMRELLLERDAPEGNLYLEDKAASTFENFKNSRELADPEGPVMLVSSNYHMKRAVQTAERTGFKKIYRLPAPSDPFTFGSNVMWEVMSLLKSYR